MGVDSLLVERCIWRCEHDQCEIGNGGNVARIPRCDEIPAMPGAGRCVLRMAAARKRKAAVLLRSERGPTVRLRWIVGGMEARERYLGQNVHDSDDDSECDDLSRSRPDAGDSRSCRLRRVARSRDEGLGRRLGTSKTIRRQLYALLCGEQPGQ